MDSIHVGGWLRAVLCPLQPGDAAAERRDERRVALAERCGRLWAPQNRCLAVLFGPMELFSFFIYFI